MGELSHFRGWVEGTDSCTAGGQSTCLDKDYAASTSESLSLEPALSRKANYLCGSPVPVLTCSEEESVSTRGKGRTSTSEVADRQVIAN